MGLLSAIALILLTMVGYSSGVTLAGRGRNVLPSIWDLLLLVATWWGAFQLRALLDSRLWGLLAGLLLGLVMGAVFTAVRLTVSREAPLIPESELPEHARERHVNAPRSLPRRLWDRWNAFATRMGAVQGRLLMGFFYFLIVTPFGAVARLGGDALHQKRPFAASGWSSKEPVDLTLEQAHEQG